MIQAKSNGLDILTVLEDGGRIDRLSGTTSIGNGKLRVSVDENSNIEMHLTYHDHKRTRAAISMIYLEEVNLNDLIHFLQEAKQFIDEQEVVNRLMGK